MQFTIVTVLFTLFAMLSSALNTVALPVLLKRDVYNPLILSPAAGDRFDAGEKINVYWYVPTLVWSSLGPYLHRSSQGHIGTACRFQECGEDPAGLHD